MTPEEQARALTQAAGVRVRDDLCLLALDGEDQRSWLSGQVTGDVRELRAGGSVYCLAVNVRGKIMADVWVIERAAGLALLVPRAAREQLLESFEGQIIMEDVEVTPVESVAVVSVQGPLAARALEAAGVEEDVHDCDELGHGGRFVLTTTQASSELRARLVAAAEELGGGEVGEAGFELARLRARRPRFGVDFDLRHYPQEAGLKERAVSFNKGCYLGQEVVCTLENRGRLSRELMALRADAALAPGTPLEDDAGAAIGEVTSSAHDGEAGTHIALGYLKRAHAEAGRVVHAGGVAVHVESRIEGAG